jgi:hypothetical protein
MAAAVSRAGNAAPIQARKTGIDARLTYWCATCQKAGGAG